MKKYKGFLFVLLAILLAVGLFHAGTVYAATDCFNDIGGLSTVFQEAICWMAENGITSGIGGGAYGPSGYVTRAQMALFMYRQAQVPPETGYILVSAGNSNWATFSSASTITINRYSTVTRLSRPTTGSEFVTIHPDFPPVLYGKSLQFVGVEFCYTASTSALLNYVEINTHLASSDAGTRILEFSDNTDRSDSACRYYVLPAPVTMTAESGVSFYVSVDWATASTAFDIGRTTFVFQPTGTTAVAPASLSENVVTLSEASQGAGIPDTSAP